MFYQRTYIVNDENVAEIDVLTMIAREVYGKAGSGR